MSTIGAGSVAVAPREIRDYVYRATRLTGTDHGVANEVARAALFAHIQLDSHLANVVEALELGEGPKFGLPFVETAESAPDRTALLPDGFVVADLALFAWEACQRGHEIQMTCGDGEQRSPTDWLTTGRAGLGIAELRVVDQPANRSAVARTDSRRRQAHSNGCLIDQGVWTRMGALAAGYLVAESDIDAVG